MAKSNEKDPCRITTPKFRVSFPSVFKATSFQDQAPKFSVQMLFDKRTDIKPLKAAAALAIKNKYGDKIPKGLTMPFKDGNDKDLEGYGDTIVVNASSKFQPGLIDRNKNAILNEADFYPGCYARADVRAIVYEVTDPKRPNVVLKRGVSFQLNHIQKLEEGENLGGRTSAEDAFDDVSDSSDDSSSYESGGDLDLDLGLD